MQARQAPSVWGFQRFAGALVVGGRPLGSVPGAAFKVRIYCGSSIRGFRISILSTFIHFLFFWGVASCWANECGGRRSLPSFAKLCQDYGKGRYLPLSFLRIQILRGISRSQLRATRRALCNSRRRGRSRRTRRSIVTHLTRMAIRAYKDTRSRMNSGVSRSSHPSRSTFLYRYRNVIRRRRNVNSHAQPTRRQSNGKHGKGIIRVYLRLLLFRLNFHVTYLRRIRASHRSSGTPHGARPIYQGARGLRRRLPKRDRGRRHRRQCSYDTTSGNAALFLARTVHRNRGSERHPWQVYRHGGQNGAWRGGEWR